MVQDPPDGEVCLELLPGDTKGFFFFFNNKLGVIQGAIAMQLHLV